MLHRQTNNISKVMCHWWKFNDLRFLMLCHVWNF